MANPSLKTFCKNAIKQLSVVKGDEYTNLYSILRYNDIGRLFPHDAFSEDESKDDFFERTLVHLAKPDTIPQIKKDIDQNKLNYINWLVKYK